MRRRKSIVVVALLVLGAGLFVAGRASNSSSPVATSVVLTTEGVSRSFSPLSVDFTSLVDGWALGTTPCHVTSVCLSLSKTTNAGRSWTTSQLPPALLQLADVKVDGTPSIKRESLTDDDGPTLNVRFANANDGWIYGSLDVPPKVGDATFETTETILWSTHDGGGAWQAQQQSWIRQSSVLDLEATARTVYLMALSKSLSVSVESSPLGSDRWRDTYSKGLNIPAGGGELQGAIVLSGSRGWLFEGNDRGVDGSAQYSTFGTWRSWTPPCYAEGNGLPVLSAATPRRLIVECQLGGYASPLSKSAPPGAKLGETWLYQSNNAGRTFTAVADLGPYGQFFGPALASPRPGTFLFTKSEGRSQNLLASFDDGHEWSTVYSGFVAFIHFVSPNEGVALDQRAHGPNRLLMTFDGGRDWMPIHF